MDFNQKEWSEDFVFKYYKFLCGGYKFKYINKLKEKNIIKRIGANKNGYWEIIK